MPSQFPPLTTQFAREFPDLVRECAPSIPTDTRVGAANAPLARELGIDSGAEIEAVEGLARSFANAHTAHAMAYSGHQFGTFSPVLGDGRAHLMGELTCGDAIVDVHLKGSGPTPFSRPGSDGKAPLSAMYREYLISEALDALGIPTSRALAVLETGERIRRRAPEPEPAGILVRTASSHVRVGTFQFARIAGDQGAIAADTRDTLVRFVLDRHYPGWEESADARRRPALALLRGVAARQARLVAQWMGVGFVHGVLNTDNVSVAGESIDFGPCAFLDRYEAGACFSSIDTGGRYAYDQQPAITQWNLARFAEALLDLIDPDPQRAIDDASAVLAEFEGEYRAAFTRVFARKLGIEAEPDVALAQFVANTLESLEREHMDFTLFFRSLAEGKSIDGEFAAGSAWRAELEELRSRGGTSLERAEALMRETNPIYIPRNHHVEAALRDVERGERGKFERLLAAIREPWTRRDGFEDLEAPPPNARFFTSFCGT